MALHPTLNDLPAKAGDEVTADLFTGMTGDIDKQLWLVEAHLQADS
ncbi:MAG: hypothetical protein RLZZ200_2092 [Pseudomonadota bacterium]|jgi:DNA-binding ferritin-like protein